MGLSPNMSSSLLFCLMGVVTFVVVVAAVVAVEELVPLFCDSGRLSDPTGEGGDSTGEVDDDVAVAGKLD